MVIPDLIRHRPAPPLTRGRLEWVLGTRPMYDRGAAAHLTSLNTPTGLPRARALLSPPDGYFEYSSTTNCSCAAIGRFGRVGRSSMRPLNVSRSTASHDSGAPRDD